MVEVCNAVITNERKSMSCLEDDETLSTSEMKKLCENETKLLILEYLTSSLPETSVECHDVVPSNDNLDIINDDDVEDDDGDGHMTEDIHVTEGDHMGGVPRGNKSRGFKRSQSYLSVGDFIKRREMIKTWHDKHVKRHFIHVEEKLQKTPRKIIHKIVENEHKEIEENELCSLNEDQSTKDLEYKDSENRKLNGGYSYLPEEDRVSVKKEDAKLITHTSYETTTQPGDTTSCTPDVNDDGNTKVLNRTPPSDKFNESKRKLECLLSGKGKNYSSKSVKSKRVPKLKESSCTSCSNNSTVGETCCKFSTEEDDEDGITSYEKFQARRAKVQRMLLPVRKYVKRKLRREIVSFDNETLSPTNTYRNGLLVEKNESFEDTEVRERISRDEFSAKREKVKQLLRGRSHTSTARGKENRKARNHMSSSRDDFLQNREKLRNHFEKPAAAKQRANRKEGEYITQETFLKHREKLDNHIKKHLNIPSPKMEEKERKDDTIKTPEEQRNDTRNMEINEVYETEFIPPPAPPVPETHATPTVPETHATPPETHATPPANDVFPDYQTFADDPSYTPEMYAVDCLEAISNDIMDNHPDLLFGAVHNLLSEPLLTYDYFTRFADSLWSMWENTVVTKRNIWARIGMVLSVVKEAFIWGDLSDSEMETIVDYSTKYVVKYTTENKILLHPLHHVAYDVIDEEECEEVFQGGEELCSEVGVQETGGNVRSFQDFVYEWIPFLLAMLAVGVGVAYSCRKT